MQSPRFAPACHQGQRLASQNARPAVQAICDRNCESLQQAVATLSYLSLLLNPRDGMLFMFMAERKQGTCEHIEGLSKGRANRGLPVALKLVPNLRRDAGWRLLSFPPEHFTLRPPFHVFA